MDWMLAQRFISGPQHPFGDSPEIPKIKSKYRDKQEKLDGHRNNNWIWVYNHIGGKLP
jgi:hypothetical protein